MRIPTPIRVHCHETLLRHLGTAELLVVCVIREWVAPLANPGPAGHDWRLGMVAAGIEADGAPAFDALMTILATSAARPLDIRRQRDPRLGTDEAALLRLVGALQREDEREAADILARCLPPAAARFALGPARVLARELALGGLTLRNFIFSSSSATAAPIRDGATVYPDRGLSLLQ